MGDRPGGPVDRRSGVLERQQGVGEVVLDGLEAPDRGPELVALADIVDGHVDQVSRQPAQLGGRPQCGAVDGKAEVGAGEHLATRPPDRSRPLRTVHRRHSAERRDVERGEEPHLPPVGDDQVARLLRPPHPIGSIGERDHRLPRHR